MKKKEYVTVLKTKVNTCDLDEIDIRHINNFVFSAYIPTHMWGRPHCNLSNHDPNIILSIFKESLSMIGTIKSPFNSRCTPYLYTLVHTKEDIATYISIRYGVISLIATHGESLLLHESYELNNLNLKCTSPTDYLMDVARHIKLIISLGVLEA